MSTSVSQPFSEALVAYRKRAADRFALRRSIARTSNRKCTGPSSSSTPYRRALFPALIDYLSQAAASYKQWKQSPPIVPCTSLKPTGGALGHGDVVEALAADVRRAKWLVARQLESHRKRAVNRVLRDLVLACGIPEDVRRKYRERFLNRVRNWKKVSFARKVGNREEGDLLAYDGTNHNGYKVHVARCRDAFQKGHSRLVRQGLVERRDTFEEVHKRYLGKPDEMYRRRTARRFARYRRERKEREVEALKQSTKAEIEMKRRRGHDHLLTGRDTGDASFAPFLFELDSNAYAFSSKITEAPKLRKLMIDKYSKDDKGADCMNGWQKAQQAAETNPLFHTRVMNRFM